MPIFELGQALPVKSHVGKFGSDWLSLSRVTVVTDLGGRNPLLGHYMWPCNAHLQTWPGYSSQKPRVKIWFGLVEPFRSYCVHKHFSGGQKPPIRRGYIWPVMPISELGWTIPVRRHVWKFGLDWLKLEVCLILRVVGRPPITGGGGVMCDLWCPFSNLAKVF